MSLVDVLLHWLGSQQDRYWSSLEKQSKGMTSNHGMQATETSPTEMIHILSSASSSSSQQRSRLTVAIGIEALPARRTKRRVTRARRRPDWLWVSTSVGMSSAQEEVIAASLTPMRLSNRYHSPERSHKQYNYIATNLMQIPWEDSVQGWVPHSRISHAQPQIRFRIQLEHKQKQLRGKQEVPRKNETLKDNSAMMPSLYLSFRCKLVFGNHECPLFYTYKKELTEMRKEDYHNSSSDELATPSRKVSENRLGSIKHQRG